MKLDGKVALVSGAGRGIGRAIAERFAGEGAAVVVTDVDAATLDDTLGVINGRGDCSSHVCDVSDSEAVAAVFAQVDRRYGRFDVLVNNAGIGNAPGDGFDRYAEALAERQRQIACGEQPTVFAEHSTFMEDRGWLKVLAITLNGVFWCSREALRLMVKHDIKGSIVNISSTSALSGEGGSHYCAAKGGVLGLTKGLAEEFGPRGIRVNAICPGVTRTPAVEVMGEQWLQSMVQAVPLGRIGLPEDIAATAAFLASDDASYFTGQTLVCNGGVRML